MRRTIFPLRFGRVLTGWLVLWLVHLLSGDAARASPAPRPAGREVHYATPGQLADAGTLR